MSDDIPWRRFGADDPEVDYVEVGEAGDEILVRDGKDPDGPALRFTRAEIRAFILGVKAGEFDDLIQAPPSGGSPEGGD